MTDKPSEVLADRIDACCADNPERAVVLEWILDEWLGYANGKWGPVDGALRSTHDADMEGHGWGRGGFWANQVLQYVSRCEQFGVHGADHLALKGRQAAMKMGTTLLDGLASMVRVHGLPPGPGPSGEIVPWEPTA